MKIKVCGLKDPENMLLIDAVHPDFLGVILYEKSPRFYSGNSVPKTVAKRVGVFVNETIPEIDSKVEKFKLDYIQLHGTESVEVVENLFLKGHKIIKAFNIDDSVDNELLKRYQSFCSYFLFDTKGKNAGGNGVKFNWSVLNDYTLPLPFLLSGGIQPGDVPAIKRIKHTALAAVDINSGFESSAGIKNIELVKQFIHEIRCNETQTS